MSLASPVRKSPGYPWGPAVWASSPATVFAIIDGERDEIRILGGSERLDRVGEGLDGGRILVEGDVGQRLAFGMTAARLRVTGSAGPFAASGASGGIVRIAGDADERAGAAVHGAMHGLNGATLVIGGSAGAGSAIACDEA